MANPNTEAAQPIFQLQVLFVMTVTRKFSQLLQHNGGSASTTVANACNPSLARLQAVHQMVHNPCSTGTKRVTKAHSATVNVDLVMVKVVKLHICEHHH